MTSTSLITVPADNPSVVMAPYLEPVVRGRRVAVLGDALQPLGQALLERGARLVHVYDPNTTRVAQALAQQQPSRTLMIAPLPEGDLAVRDGAFDAVIVPDLMMFDPVDSLVAKTRKLVATHGHAVFVSPNPDTTKLTDTQKQVRLLSYYELYDVIALQFPEVRMLGQAPFCGYVIADFAPETDPDVVVDTSLVDAKSQEPRWFVALGTHQPRRLDPYTIIQTPFVCDNLIASSDASSPKDTSLGTTYSTADTSSNEGGGRLENAFSEAQNEIPIVPRVGTPSERLDALQATLREREQQLRQAEARAGDNHVRAERLENKVRDLEQELFHQRDRAFRMSNDLEGEKKQRTKAELELGIARSRNEMSPVGPTISQAQLDKLQTALTQCEQTVSTVEKQLAAEKKRVQQREDTITALRDELEDQRATNQQHETRVISLQKQLTERQNRIEQLDAQIVQFEQSSTGSDVELALDRSEKTNVALRKSLQEALSRANQEATLRAERDRAYRTIERVRDEQLQTVNQLTLQRDALKQSLKEATTSLQQEQRDCAVLHRQLHELQQQREGSNPEALEQLKKQLNEVQNELQSVLAQHERDVDQLESTLQQRARHIQDLQSDIAHHERLARELVEQLQVQQTPEATFDPNDQLQRRINSLVDEAAVREGELQQARWRIGQLEQNMRQIQHPDTSADVVALEQALFAAINEQESLRKQLQDLQEQQSNH